MLLAPGAICSTYAEPAQLPAYPLLRLGVEGDGELRQCQRSSELRCGPAAVAFVGKLVAEVAYHDAVRQPLLTHRLTSMRRGIWSLPAA